MNAALINGIRKFQSQPRQRTAAVPSSHRRVRFEALLARVRSRQLDLAMMGKVEESALYAQRASMLAAHIVIVDDVVDVTGSSDDSVAHMEEPMLACCGV